MKTQKKPSSKKSVPPKFDINNKTDVKNIALMANRLLKGIDNETAAVMKLLKNNNERIEKVAENLEQLSRVVSTVTNAAITNSAQGAVSAAKQSPKSSPKSPAPAKNIKQPNTGKNVSKKTEIKAKGQKNAAVSADRPPLKNVIDGILGKYNGGPVKASVIYSEACSGKEKWSRQSFYNALKDNSRYARSGDGADTTYRLVKSTTITEDETENLIRKAESNYSAIANVI